MESSSSTIANERLTGPVIHNIADLPVPEWKTTQLDNGTRLIEVDMGSQELVSMEIIHFASRLQEDKKGASRATARLLREGTATMTSGQIAEKVDSLGASLGTGANLDFTFIKLFTLTKYFDDLLPIVEDIRYRPTFPQEELDRYKKNSIQKLALDEAKVELQSYKSITESLFGDEHPYGYNSDEAIYSSITREDLIHHFENYYGSENSIIILCGRISEHIRTRVVEVFGNSQKSVSLKTYNTPQPITNTVRKTIKAVDKSQSGIKLGMKLWNRSNKDFPGVFVLNTVLGGYFGSRLMTKIREEKGYTYSIYSGLDMMQHDGYFFISTEVSHENVEDTIAATYEEIHRLKTELLDNEEMQMIKTFLRGNFLNMVDGPFKVGGMVKLLEVNSLPRDFFTSLSQYVSNVTPEDIRNYAKQYLHRDKLLEVVVG